MPAPERVAQPLLAACRSEIDAIRIAMKMKPGGPFTDSWFASRLGVSRSYLCAIKKGERPFPVWMRRPFAYLTGSLLLTQWHELQSAMRQISGAETQADRDTRILREAGVAIFQLLEKCA